MSRKFFNKLDYNLLDNELKKNLCESFICYLRGFSESKDVISVSNFDKVIDLYDLVLESNSEENLSFSLNTFFYTLIYNVLFQKIEIDDEVILLLFLYSFDSFSSILVKDFECTLEVSSSLEVFLPNNEVRLFLGKGVLLVRKVDKDIVFHNNGLNPLKIFNQPRHHKLPKVLELHPRDSIVKKLVLPYYNEVNLLLGNSNLRVFEERLWDAFKTIYMVDEILYNDILSTIEFYVPLIDPAKCTSTSFTFNHFPHVTFVSDSHSITTILENIIHEYHHDKLNLTMKFYDFISDKGGKYFSPWRNDVRPVNGLVHGIYVFVEIYSFYVKALDNENDLITPEYRSFISFRMRLIYHELQLAFFQVKADDSELMDLGREFIAELYSILTTFPSYDFIEQVPNEIYEHLQNWVVNNGKSTKLYIPDKYSLSLAGA